MDAVGANFGGGGGMTFSLRASWERASLYLPIALMALLALGTYWLVRTMPSTAQPALLRALRHEPDYFMRTFSVKSFDTQGRLQSEISGTEGRHFPDTDTLEIDQVQMRAFSLDGKITRASADRALSNSDGSEIQLFGNAVVVREASTDAKGRVSPPLEFRSEFLHAYTKTERVQTNLPVLVVRGLDSFTAIGLDFDNLDQRLDLHSRVRGQLMPRPAR